MELQSDSFQQRELALKDVSVLERGNLMATLDELYLRYGFRTESQSHGADGGVDIWLYSKHATGPAAIVQCKHWKNQAIGVKELSRPNSSNPHEC